jgi:hypothetical protein
MGMRKPNNYASQFIYIVYICGIVASTWGHDPSWGRYWRATLWPFYIAWIEVPKYLDAAITGDRP